MDGCKTLVLQVYYLNLWDLGLMGVYGETDLLGGIRGSRFAIGREVVQPFELLSEGFLEEIAHTRVE